MVLLPLHQSCCITQAVGLPEDRHIPQQLAVGDEDGIWNLVTSESSEGDGIGGVWGGAKTPLVLEGLTRVGRLEACEVEGNLAGVGPKSWHSHPEMPQVVVGVTFNVCELQRKDLEMWHLASGGQLACVYSHIYYPSHEDRQPPVHNVWTYVLRLCECMECVQPAKKIAMR